MLDKKRPIHFIGIGGSGLSAIARLLLESGYTVTGSDRSLSPLAQDLAAAGARVFAGHSPDNVLGAGVVVRSSAVADDNPEVQAALQAGIPVLKRAQFLGQLMENRFGIAVAGTHGKTTVTSMVAWLLVSLEQDPSYIIGGTAKNLGGKNAHAGQGKAFVIEADEYDRMFLGLKPDLALVNSLEHDHPDCYPTPELYFQAFVDFIHNIKPGGVLLTAEDQPEARRLAQFTAEETQAYTFGTGPGAAYQARGLAINDRGGFDYDAYRQRPNGEAVLLAHISLQVPGEHNVRNSLGALAVIDQMSGGEGRADLMARAAKALGEFSGTGRRFDILGEAGGVVVVDDYAHHPTKIQATLAAARARYPQRRIWAVWQPHTYSRTRSLQAEFARSFTNADQVVVTEVYAAREKAEDFDHFSAAQAVEQIRQPEAHFVPDLQETTRFLLDAVKPGDVVLVLSAGDADQVGRQVLAALLEREAKNA